MPLKIAQLGQPVLREKAKPVRPERLASPEFQAFVDEMLTTMHAARGVGLAGPQVFASERIFTAVVLPTGNSSVRPEVFINPVLKDLSAETRPGWEGCLSFRELMVLVPRHQSLTIEYLDRKGEPRSLALSGYAARVVQHEFDHLEGILTIDRAESTRDIVKESEMNTVLETRGEFEDDEDEEDDEE